MKKPCSGVTVRNRAFMLGASLNCFRVTQSRTLSSHSKFGLAKASRQDKIVTTPLFLTMAAGTVYLIRKTNGTFAKYADALSVSLTGQVTAYSSITGVAATDVVSIPGLTAVDGIGLTFTSLTGGAGLSTGVKYYLVNSSGSTAKLATSQGGTAVNFTTNITAGTLLIQTDELFVWSSEFRDIFAVGSSTQQVTLGSPSAQSVCMAATATAITFPTVSLVDIGGSTVLQATVAPTVSDEFAHVPLRQTFLARTHWKFTMSSGPSPLYATWADGDIIANNPPNT